jgi:hypothetical protein
LRRLPGDTPLRFVPNSKSGKSAARYAVYGGASTVGEYRLLNSAPEFVLADLKNDLERGLASIPPALWAQRVGGDPILAAAAAASLASAGPLESVQAFVVRCFPETAPAWDGAPADLLHAQAMRLAYHDLSLAAARRFEELEDESPSPPHVGGDVVRELVDVD